MTTSVPAVVTWPLLVMMVVIVGLRYRFFNTNQFEKYLNHTLAILVLSNLLRERVIEDFLAREHILSVTMAQQLSLAVMIPMAAEFIGFVTLWRRPSYEATPHLNRNMRVIAAVLAVGFMGAATPARRAGMTLENYGGWWSVLAWILLTALLMTLAVRIMQMSLQEYRNPDAQPREKVLTVAGMVVGVAVGVTSLNAPLLATLDTLGWFDATDFLTYVDGRCIFWETVGSVLISGIPPVLLGTSMVRLDATGRNWSQLQPLRSSMGEAVPGVVFDFDAPKNTRQISELDLHHTTVQIRDAILALRVYSRDLSTADADAFFRRYGIPPTHHEFAAAALQLAYAAQAKAAGSEPSSSSGASMLTPRSDNLEDETAELLRLARWWQKALAEVRAQSNSTEMSEHP